MPEPEYRRDVADWIVRRVVPVTGVPADLAIAIFNGEAPGLDINADGGTAHGLWQVEAPVHGGTRETWIGFEGAERALVHPEIGGRWARAWASADQNRWRSDPIGFLNEFWYAAQGADPAAIARRAPQVLVDGAAIWRDYQGTTTPPVSDLYYDAASGMLLPARGPVTQGYGVNPNNGIYTDRGHPGIDIAGGWVGADVLAVRDGWVPFAGWVPGTGYGIGVIVEDAEGVWHLYAHLSRTEVIYGDRIRRGQILGRVGETGNTFGAHLHYGVYHNKQILDANHFDPTPYLLLGPQWLRARVKQGMRPNIRSEPREAPDTLIGTLDPGTEVYVPADAYITIVTEGKRVWSWAELYEPIGITSPPPADDSTYRLAAIRAWTHVRDGAAFVIEDADVKSIEAKRQAQATIDMALGELRNLGVDG